MIYKWELSIPSLSPELTRRAYLYLPAAYDDDPAARFPVLYMFDGHNVFFDEDATYGKSWGMARYMDEHGIPLIIAAVECNSVGNGRLCEYSPFSHKSSTLGFISGLGHETMEWLVNEFKPMIDAQVRTLPDREHTLIAGSSMGGLMSLYAVASYNHVFSRAACLSPSLWVGPAKVRRLIRDADISPDTVVYMDYGAREMPNHEKSIKVLCDTCTQLVMRGVDLTFRIVPGGTHCEASWERQIPVFMQCLGF